MTSTLASPMHQYVSLRLCRIIEAKLQRNSRGRQQHLDPKTCARDTTRARRETDAGLLERRISLVPPLKAGVADQLASLGRDCILRDMLRDP
jgi:hypothetical protein